MSDTARYETLAELEASEEFPKIRQLLEDMAGEVMMWRGQAASELPLLNREAGFSRGLSLDAARGLVDKYWPD